MVKQFEAGAFELGYCRVCQRGWLAGFNNSSIIQTASVHAPCKLALRAHPTRSQRIACARRAFQNLVAHPSLHGSPSLFQPPSVSLTEGGMTFPSLPSSAPSQKRKPSGITADFASYLVELVTDKLEIEYMNWLQRVRVFLEKGRK